MQGFLRCSLPEGWRVLIMLVAVVLLIVPTLASVPKIICLSTGAHYSIGGPPEFEKEQLTYEFTWEGIPAATGEWTASRCIVDGKKVLRAKGTVRTVDHVDMIWKMRGKIEAMVDDDPITPRRFILRKRENSRRRDTTLDFDHQSGTLRIIRVGKSGRPREYKREITGQYDPVSAAFALRSLKLGKGEKVQIDVQLGRSVYRVDIQVLGREQVKVRAGTYNAIVLSPSVYNLTKDEPCTGLKSARVWLSDDPQRTVLKAESQIFVGSVCAELTARLGDGEHGTQGSHDSSPADK